jgi:hypothetical protein
LHGCKPNLLESQISLRHRKAYGFMSDPQHQED